VTDSAFLLDVGFDAQRLRKLEAAVAGAAIHHQDLIEAAAIDLRQNGAPSVDFVSKPA
jgi:hypothetical protein